MGWAPPDPTAGSDPVVVGGGCPGHHRHGRAGLEHQRRAGGHLVLTGREQHGAVHGPSVDPSGRRDREGLADLDDDIGGDVDGGALGDRRGRRPADGAVVVEEVDDEHEGGHRDGGELEPVLERLDEGDRAHAAADDVADDDDGDRDDADPVGNPEQDVQCQSRALELGDEVEHADDGDDHHRQGAQPSRTEPELREVRHGVGAGPAQRGGDEQQQTQVARGEAHRVPQGVGAVLGDESGYAEKGGSGKVFTGDRGGVPAGSDAAGGDEEVGGGAGQPDSVDADRDGGGGGEDETDDGGDGDRTGVHGPLSRRPGR